MVSFVIFSTILSNTKGLTKMIWPEILLNREDVAEVGGSSGELIPRNFVPILVHLLDLIPDPFSKGETASFISIITLTVSFVICIIAIIQVFIIRVPAKLPSVDQARHLSLG